MTVQVNPHRLLQAETVSLTLAVTASDGGNGFAICEGPTSENAVAEIT